MAIGVAAGRNAPTAAAFMGVFGELAGGHRPWQRVGGA